MSLKGSEVAVLRKAPLLWLRLAAVAEAEECGNRRYDFQGLREGRKTVLSFSGLSTNRHFLRLCSCRGPQPVEEFGFCLLHSSGRVSVAEGGGDSLERLDAESRAQEPAGFFDGQQGLQRGPVVAVADAFSPLWIDGNLGLDVTHA